MTYGRTAALIVVGALLPAGAASAQTYDRLQIKVEGNVVSAVGGERTSVGTSSGPLVIGKMTPSGIGKEPRMECGLYAGPRLTGEATKGWSLEFTPTQVQGDAVTFHVRWTRLDAGKESEPVDANLTLRPGESTPLDFLPLTPSASASPPCRLTGMAIRMSVDYWPRPEQEARLIATDLWLVEKAPDGAERTQQVTVRGLPNQNLPFYFSPITDGGVSLDIFGELRGAPGRDQLELTVVARSRVVEGGQGSTTLRVGSYLTSRKVEPPPFKIKPGEVVSVELPRLSENVSGAFSSRTLSLRIRSQQVR